MKSFYIADLSAGIDLLNEPYLIHDVVRRVTKDGRPYLLATLRDKTGLASAVFWDVPDYVEKWARTGLIVLVSGRVKNYKDSQQINITDINPCPDPELADFLPASQRTRQEMIAELRKIIAELSEPWQTLATYILLDEAFLEKYAIAPAARMMHHAYISGLLEHSLSMAKLAQHLSQHYSYVNKDLLVTGALLHDMGKTMEYNTNSSFDSSDDGRLVGHIIRAIVIIEKAAAELDFPEESLRHLVHLIASHHGTLEWGSPVVPKTLEAILLHQIDLLDSRIQGFFDHISNDEGEESWTVRNSLMFKTELFRPEGFDSP